MTLNDLEDEYGGNSNDRHSESERTANDDDESFEPLEKKIKRMKKRINGKKKSNEDWQPDDK